MRIQLPDVEETQLNLIPIMNLFTALIPFLLMSAAFFHMAVIQVTVPVASTSGETDVEKEEEKITLTVRLTEKAFEVSTASDTIDPEVLKSFNAKIPRSIDSPEAAEKSYAQLSEHAFKIKTQYTESDRAIVVPDNDIPYSQVIETLDALRQTLREISGARRKVALFPKVVLSSLVE